jgi:ribose transport system substrate-binding protein
MRTLNRVLALILITCLLLPVSGCTGSKLSTQDKKVIIKVIVKKKDASFWTVVRMGAEAAGKEFNVSVDFDGPTDEKDIDGQIRMVEGAITEKVDALVLAASDYTRLVGVAEQAVREDIPVIIIDSDIDSDKMYSFIGTDNVDAGKLLAESMLGKVGENCNISVMSFIKGAASSDQREEGLFEVISKNTSVKVLSTEYCNSSEDVAEQLTENLIQKYPELNAIVCTNAYGTVGTARAVEKLGKAGKIKVIGFDSTPDEISFMERDVVQSLIVQNPFNMGYLGIKYALDAHQGKSLPKRENTGSKAIDKNNMYEPENEKLLFPFTN